MEPDVKLDPMTAMALRSLHDITVPQPVSMLPHTWGWAALAGIVFVLLLVVAIRAIQRFRRNAYRRAALQRISVLEAETSDAAGAQVARELAEVLKQTALAAWPRRRVAALTGAKWVSFLGLSDRDDQALAQLLDDFEYRGDAAFCAVPETKVKRALRITRRWIEGHNVSA